MRHRHLARLSWRLFTTRWKSHSLLVFSLAATLLGSLALNGTSVSIEERLNADARNRYGTARVSIPASARESGDPRAAHTMVGSDSWISADELSTIAEILREEQVGVQAEIMSEGMRVDDGAYTPVRVVSGPGSPAAAAGAASGWPRTPGRQVPNENETPDGKAPRTLIASTSPDSARGYHGEFLDLSAAGIRVTDDTSMGSWVWADRGQLLAYLTDAGVAPVSTVGNSLRIDSLREQGASEVAFNVRELLDPHFPGIEVRSLYEIAGRSATTSATNIPALLSLAILLPAVAAVVGTVLVLIESRSDELALLDTLGFDAPLTRRLLVQQILFASALAAALGTILYIATAAAIPILHVRLSPILGRTLVAAAVPPALGFLVARRARSPADTGERLAEFRR